MTSPVHRVDAIHPFPPLTIIGAGRAGSGLALAWHAAGVGIAAVVGRSRESAYGLAAQIGARALSLDEMAIAPGDLVVIAVSDDAIAPLATGLANGGIWRGAAALHISGATPVRALDPLAHAGALVGGLHPAFPFSADRRQIPDLRGVTFAVESDDPRLRGWLTALVDAVGGRTLRLTAEARALYHAALVFASNYPIVLMALAERLLTAIGADDASASSAIDGLIGGMVTSVQRDGAIAALPGPLVRGDVGTIAAHLRALVDHDPDMARLYTALGRAAYPILQERGTAIDAIEALFKKGFSDAQDNP